MSEGIYTEQMAEIVALLKLMEAADLDAELKHIMIPSGIPVVDAEDELIVLGHLVASDAGIWAFKPKDGEA